jgi:polysaccharide deacetylase 2 family uncharacterized protein YibQ
LVLAAILAVALFWRHAAPPPPAHAPAGTAAGPAPLFEEPAPQPADAIRRVDEAVFDGLRRAGTPADHTSFNVPDQGGPAEIRARLKSPGKARQAARAINRGLEGLASGVWRRTKRGLELTVTLGGRVTHRVLLIIPGAPSPPPGPRPTIPAPPVAPKPRGARLALIVDDLGYQVKAARRLADLHIPITFSILPRSPHAREIAALAARRGLEVMVHLPMEPLSYPKLKPGPGALLIAMSPAQLRRTTREDIKCVPGATGANNHMGSRFTESRRALAPVLSVLKKRGLFFIDSFTSPRSAAWALAREMGLRTGRRSVFIDHDPSPQAVRRQLRRALALAKRRGGVIAIGHPHRATLDVLEEMAPLLRKRVRLTKASALISARPPVRAAAQKAGP